MLGSIFSFATTVIISPSFNLVYGGSCVLDTVDRKRLGYKMQLYLTRLTHNGHFFYYDSFFVIIMNAVTECEEILDAFSERTQKKMPSVPVYIGVSDIVSDITVPRLSVHSSFGRQPTGNRFRK